MTDQAGRTNYTLPHGMVPIYSPTPHLLCYQNEPLNPASRPDVNIIEILNLSNVMVNIELDPYHSVLH